MAAPGSPFAASIGSIPPLLVGRDREIHDFATGLDGNDGAPERMTLLTGQRGTGKSTLLAAYREQALERGWSVVSESAQGDVMSRLTKSRIPEQLEAVAGTQSRSRLTGIGASGFSVSRQVTELDVPDPDFRHQLTKLHDAVMNHNPTGGVLVLVDEIKAGPEIDEIGAAMQQMRWEGRNIAFAGAGVSSDVSQILSADGYSSFLRRADIRRLAAVTPQEASAALRVPIESTGRGITPDALRVAVQATRGYPFLIQSIGHESWMAAGNKPTIDLQDVQHGIVAAREAMGNQVIDYALSGVTAEQRQVLTDMARQGGQTASLSGAQRNLGLTSEQMNERVDGLMKADLVRFDGTNGLSFRVPYMAEHLRQNSSLALAAASRGPGRTVTGPGNPVLNPAPRMPQVGLGGPARPATPPRSSGIGR